MTPTRVAICDEVYEHLVFDDRPHIPLASLPGMASRCLRIGSSREIVFAYRLESGLGHWPNRTRPCRRQRAPVHHIYDVACAPARHRLCTGARDGFFTLNLTKTLQANRDILSAGIKKLGFQPLACEGSYFLTADIRGLTNEGDLQFCERLVREVGVALIPLSPFFKEGKPDNLVRFAFCKKRAVIEDALARLQVYFQITPTVWPTPRARSSNNLPS
ncbi:MAG: aminotransferase class I/II-fold pyridoxal phosphate-dependent enzyme [Rhizomicrobium sp.]